MGKKPVNQFLIKNKQQQQRIYLNLNSFFSQLIEIDWMINTNRMVLIQMFSLCQINIEY